ncbi:YtxH domain-containing protein, partial [Microvirga sp. 3-52]|nr:YtxH domain-containing protein [Microvirga sp. 3-52]
NDRGYTDSFYDEYEYVDSGAGSFLVGAIVGGVIGAAAALFLAPKTGKEMREDFTTQASQLKDKGIEISTVAKDKATEYTTIAKDKATEYSSVAKDKATEYSSAAKEKA